MSRVPKIKQFKEASLITEDSSDYISSDFEGSKLAKLDGDGGSNLTSNAGLVEDSNESFFYDTDTMNSQPATSGGASSENKSRKKSHQKIDEGRLAESLNYLHRTISRKDKEDIFQFPVTDSIAPGYSQIIKHPMDLSAMKKKIDTYAYNNIMEYRDDLILMCENCLTYNKPDTIYYHAANKMLEFGLKLMSREKLLSMRRQVSFMRMLSSNELGFSLEGDSTEHVHDLNSFSNRKKSHSIMKMKKPHHQKHHHHHLSRTGPTSNYIIAARKVDSQDSRLVPPEGEADNDDDDDDDDDEDITESVKRIAQEASERLAIKNKHGKMGYLKRNPNGSTGYHFLNEEHNVSESKPSEKLVTIGNLCEGLQASNYSMSSFLEDKKNPDSPMYFLENGPFSSHAPVYDTSYGNLTKEETAILLSTYGDETAYQYALSLMNFAKDSGFLFNQYVNLVLNSLSNKEHEKYMQYLKKKQAESSIKNELS